MKYKNISKKDLSLIGIGIVKAGEIIETKEAINNANFKIVKEAKDEENQPDQSQKTNKDN